MLRLKSRLKCEISLKPAANAISAINAMTSPALCTGSEAEMRDKLLARQVESQMPDKPRLVEDGHRTRWVDEDEIAGIKSE